MFRQRLRFWFAKEGLSRFLSHHDLMRLFERALRRSGLPLKLSEGFNPRPSVSFPVALALGVEALSEIVEVDLVEWVSPSKAARLLSGQLPEGLTVLKAESVAYGEKAEVSKAHYSVRLGRVPAGFSEKLDGFLRESSVPFDRAAKSGVKRIDIRRFVRTARLDGDTLVMELCVSPAGSVRPEEVLEVVSKEPAGTFAPLAITRTRLELAPPA